MHRVRAYMFDFSIAIGLRADKTNLTNRPDP